LQIALPRHVKKSFLSLLVTHHWSNLILPEFISTDLISTKLAEYGKCAVKQPSSPWLLLRPIRTRRFTLSD